MPTDSAGERSRGARALRIGLGVLAASGLIAAAKLLPLDEWLLAIVDWIRGAGALGMAVYAIVYVLAAVLLLPASVLTLGAGFSYGPIVGTLLVSPVSVAAATAAFLLGRSVARGFVARRVGRGFVAGARSAPRNGSARFAAIDRAIGESGFQIVFLLRLSPIFPFNLLNYALGLTRVRLVDYVLASWIGMLPGTFLYVYLGSLVTNAAELLSGKRPQAGPWGHVLFFGGLVATIAVTAILTRIARRALAMAIAERSEEGRT
jgi:uncharacterized membrane protein YdjX (TVP38/TMEM64 family)